jgi:hypothetical protein
MSNNPGFVEFIIAVAQRLARRLRGRNTKAGRLRRLAGPHCSALATPLAARLTSIAVPYNFELREPRIKDNLRLLFVPGGC